MATADKTENKTKVLVNVYEPLIAIMKHKFDAACLKRDAYLDKALRIEAGFLRSEVKEPNSDRARNFIAENLKELKLKPLSLSLSTETVELVNEVCKEKNIPRDSFINRLFLLLIASETILKALFLFHQVKIEDIEEAFLCAKEGWGFEKRDRIEQINILDLFESFSEKPPLLEIRELLCERVFDIVPEGAKWKDHSEWYKKISENTWIYKCNDTAIRNGNFISINDTYTYNRDPKLVIQLDKFKEPFKELKDGQFVLKEGYYQCSSSRFNYDDPDPIIGVSDDGSILLREGYYKMECPSYLVRLDISEIKKITPYNHKFEKNCFSILPDDYSFIKTNNLLGLNMYMSDEDVDREEVLGRNVTLAKTELDRLLAFAKSEKSRKAPKKDTNPTEGESQ
ncbi:MAG: hypothetical protein WCG61_06305 [Chlorobium sp.]